MPTGPPVSTLADPRRDASGGRPRGRECKGGTPSGIPPPVRMRTPTARPAAGPRRPLRYSTIVPIGSPQAIRRMLRGSARLNTAIFTCLSRHRAAAVASMTPSCFPITSSKPIRS